MQLRDNQPSNIINDYSIMLTDSDSATDSIITLGYKPLISLISQQTGKAKNFIPSAIFIYERYVNSWIITTTIGMENLAIGWVNFGDENYPYGLYDVKIYSNSSAVNLDPVYASRQIYSSLANVYVDENAKSPIYSSYDDNDRDTMNVYITN